MKLGYAYLRNPPSAEKQYHDVNGDRAELGQLLEDVRPGDVVVVHKVGDLGRGKGLTAIRRQIKDAGATIEVLPQKANPVGRPRQFKPTVEQEAQLRALWHDTPQLQGRWLLAAASDVVGYDVLRHQLFNRYGSRDKRSD